MSKIRAARSYMGWFGALLGLGLSSGPARAERLVSAYDPSLHVRPPTMKGVDGTAAELVFDADFIAAAARYRAAHPVLAPDGTNGVTLNGEVVVVQGDDQLVMFDGTGYGVADTALPVIARRVIAAVGDNFQAITVWLTFNDRNSASAAAYEVPVKNEFQGLGPRMPVRDLSAGYGSDGVLRSMLNMKGVGLTAGDTADKWANALSVWGQESAHRWLVFMEVRDPRTGRSTDALLGRDCAHYSRYVDTQASVHDGFAWKDNGDGTFTWTDANRRYGNLDLYGMGLMAADEVPSFFFIDDIPNYKYPPSCQQYASTLRVPQQTIHGTRVDISIADIIAANGERKGPSGRQDYWRDVEVILTAPNETATSPRVVGLATRINKARLFWEQWNRDASGNRLVMCTQVTADCGDPRSDVAAVTFNTAGKAPASGPLPLEVKVTNGGARAATGIQTSIEVTVAGQGLHQDSKDVGSLDPGASRTVSFPIDVRGMACGTQVDVRASTQSDFHHDRQSASFLVGTIDRFTDGFESDTGWTINPDGDDTMTGAQWERGLPQATEIQREAVQSDAAHGGTGAWVTGLASISPSARANLVREGNATLQSPLYDTSDLHDPVLRYWVSFAGVRTDSTGQGIEPSPMSRLVVQARAVDMNAMGAAAGDWVDVDTLDNEIAPKWAQRTARLPPAAMGKNRLQLRFVATDANPEEGGVEAGIDDLEIMSNLPACYVAAMPPSQGGGGCGVDGSRPSSAAMIVLVVVLLARRRWVSRRRDGDA